MRQSHQTAALGGEKGGTKRYSSFLHRNPSKLCYPKNGWHKNELGKKAAPDTIRKSVLKLLLLYSE